MIPFAANVFLHNCRATGAQAPASCTRLLTAIIFVMFLLFGSAGLQSTFGHAGHEDIPETSVAAVGEIAFRFYSRSDQLDSTLVIHDDNTASLYLFNRLTNEPVTATVKLEQLTPENAQLQTSVGETSGVYLVSGLKNLNTTVTLTAEVEAGDLFDVLSFGNVIRPVKSTGSHTKLAQSDADHGLPAYVIISILALNALVAGLAILALIKYLVGPRRSSTSGQTIIVLFSIGCVFISAPYSAVAHEGDSHAGEGLASIGTMTASPSSRHFVSVDTQLHGDVRTSTAQIVEMPKSYTALGRISVRPDREAAITAPTDGLLLPGTIDGDIPIAGDQVKKGQVLVKLQMIIPAEDKVTISAQKVEAEADLNQARQESQLAKQELERAVKLGTYVSKSELDKLQTTYRIARDKEIGLEERISTLSAALEGETSGVKTLDLRAPIDGVISESHSTQGEYVNAGKSLFRIVNIDELFVEADIFESDVRAIENAKQARVYLEAYPDRAFIGTFHSLSPEIDPLRRTAKARFSITNKEGLLKSGMFVRVAIESGETEPMLLVPKTAIVSRENLRQVYKKIGPEIYDAVPVNVLRFLADYAMLAPGKIGSGDVVVIRGQYQVRMSPVLGAAQ